jgi:ketosteroid isomerase-like protein
MKIIISFLATAFLAAMSFAQEESASPAESMAPTTEEKASATVEETPASKPAEAASPAAARKAEAAKAAAPATAQKKETTATAAKPAAAPAAAAAPSGKKMSAEAAVKDNENRWEASYAAHDVSVAQSLVANDFVGVYWDGKVLSKSGVISEIKKDKDTYKSAKNDKLAVHSYGPNVAVVVGTAHEKGTAKDGKAFDRTFRFTDTWMLRNGQWQCVASQVMKLKG